MLLQQMTKDHEATGVVKACHRYEAFSHAGKIIPWFQAEAESMPNNAVAAAASLHFDLTCM